jgi:hypothetical protein
LFAVNFGRILVVLAGFATLAFNQRTVMRDTKVMSMGSDKEVLEVDSRSWTGLGGQSESSQPAVRNEYFNIDHMCHFCLWFNLGQIVLRIIERIIYEEFSLSFLYVKPDLNFYIVHISFAAIAFVILFFRKMSRASKKP